MDHTQSKDIQIVPYEDKYAEAFYKLNEEWISKFFKMELPDKQALQNPKGYILKPGGFIYVALLNQEPLGVCALIPRRDMGGFELAKMAVSPRAQGLGVGYSLGLACIQKARELGSEWVYLESNTRLESAMGLYKKLGFKKVEGPPTPYERCDIQMKLDLNKSSLGGIRFGQPSKK